MGMVRILSSNRNAFILHIGKYDEKALDGMGYLRPPLHVRCSMDDTESGAVDSRPASQSQT